MQSIIKYIYIKLTVLEYTLLYVDSIVVLVLVVENISQYNDTGNSVINTLV